ncbi:MULTISPECIES: geranylgeranylglycerol-phosphate geranylgeranyltransferase [unclassified Algoriphagus]|uniref:geranylgeranylglycerol-phosphate geranylgeranyltransferase n=1 Tax=unclassified Algoriphagus TaxID=2641541 RepID=UPI000C47D1A0|nr:MULTISPECIES: geranylgeranylglycerol-phosphate geranylgeranyltransferase [unclassified Algoriphagus]MAL12556.1 prenyltransferase [Algoriphagus sp.]MAN88163.1 prenyltransferase [Algoriphagus sp.]HAD51026.1 prenyltransferase [Algoriphagus sp.]HAH36660.1 prenyltransferase [Algoriphagus sp.]HAS57035.1 prenyltransferase [Algoriphagus sp.]
MTDRTISIRGLFRISRPINLLMVAFAQLMAAYFLIEKTPQGLPVLQDYRLYLLILATLLITAAGYMINDYYDVKIDYVNRPNEVIVGKGIKRRVVIFLHTIFNFTGIGLGALVAPRIAIVNFVAAFLLWLYSNRLKREPFIGNLTVAFLTGLSVYLVAFYYQKNELLVLTYAIFAFFLNLIREILKDIEDRNGDRKHGCRTLPIVIGFRKTKQVIFIVALCFVSAILIITFEINKPELFYYFGGLGIAFVWFMRKIYLADRKGHFTQLSTWAKILMLVGTMSMAFL